MHGSFSFNSGAHVLERTGSLVRVGMLLERAYAVPKFLLPVKGHGLRHLGPATCKGMVRLVWRHYRGAQPQLQSEPVLNLHVTSVMPLSISCKIYSPSRGFGHC